MIKGQTSVWAVFCGETNDEGTIVDSMVRAVYDTNEAATEHAEHVNEVLTEVGQFAGFVYWVERWNIRSGAFDPNDEEAL